MVVLAIHFLSILARRAGASHGQRGRGAKRDGDGPGQVPATRPRCAPGAREGSELVRRGRAHHVCLYKNSK